MLQNDSKKMITEFVFSGFDTVQRPLVVGMILLILYILALIANVVNICVIIIDKCLHQPMYIFICNLAFADILYSTSSCPTMIASLIAGYKNISYIPCVVQMYVFHTSNTMEMFALTVMALDRFVAVNNSLRYHCVITNVRCIVVSVLLWIVACSYSSFLPASIVNQPVCFSTVKYMFCDYATITRATCVDPEPYFYNASILSSVVIFVTFTFICLSYIKIGFVVMRMSKTDKKKTLNTCLNHFIVIACCYVPTFTRQVLTRIGVVLTIEQRNGLMVGSIVGPTLVNPFIYCLRTKQIKNKIFKIVPTFRGVQQSKT